MANYQRENVIYVDTTNATFSGNIRIKGIKYVGAASGTANIKVENNSGANLWEASGDVEVFEEACIRSMRGINVNVTNSAAVYIYLD